MYETETDIIEGCRRGNRNAQKLLYERYRIPMYRMCRRYARDDQEAEDFLHDGILKVLQDIGQYRGKGALGGWVRRVVLNVLLQQLRKRPQMMGEEALPESGEDLIEVGNDELSSLRSGQIFSLLTQLPEGYRTVFNLYYVEQRSHREIAHDLNISEGSSKSQLYKAKRALRRLIRIHYPTYQYRS